MWILLALLAHASPTAVTAGAGHSCLTRHDRTAWCWGGLSPERLRAGERPTRLTPSRIVGLEGVRQLDAGGEQRTCAALDDRSVWCWTVDGPPARVPGVQADAVSVGEAHVCALDGGAVSCWGYNAKGQLGDGTTETRTTPTPVAGPTDVVQLSAGWYHTCALSRAGTVQCWGMGTSGQLGTGRNEDQLRPSTVRFLTDAVDLDTGSSNSCAVRTTGQVVCWGAGRVGQLGTGGREGSAAIVAVPGMDRAKDVAAGLDHVCAVLRDGTVWCWGNNEAGQLGMELPKGQQLVPQQVEGIDDAVAVTAGSQHTCVLRAGGRVSCFGQNFTGQLGDGTTEKQMRPVDAIP